MVYTQTRIYPRKLSASTFWDFEIHTDCQIPPRILNLDLINNKKTSSYLMAFVLSADHRAKIKRKLKAEQIAGSCLRTEEHEDEVDINHSRCP